tara:strand:- start:183 stop:452 length:270 start_codon:yes stop_codon:yes gene_type:complete
MGSRLLGIQQGYLRIIEKEEGSALRVRPLCHVRGTREQFYPEHRITFVLSSDMVFNTSSLGVYKLFHPVFSNSFSLKASQLILDFLKDK